MFVATRAKQKQEKSQRKSRVFPFTSYFLCPTVSPTRIKQLRKTKMFTKLNLTPACGEQDRASPSVNQNHHHGCPETKQFRDHGAQPNPFDTFLWGVCTYVCALRNNLRQFLKKKKTKQNRKKKKHNNLKEIPTLRRANLRAVSQREWQPLLPRETAINWVSW